MTSSNTQSPLNAIAEQALGRRRARQAAPLPRPAIQCRAAAVPDRPELRVARPVRRHRFRADGRRLSGPDARSAARDSRRLAGRDLLVSSPTGSGKTAAFMLPAIERFSQLEKLQASQPREPRRPERPPAAPPATRRAPEPARAHADARTRDAGHGRRDHVRQAPAPSAHRQHSWRRRVWPATDAAREEPGNPRRDAGPSARPPGTRPYRPVEPDRCSCSTKPTACSTWASSTTSRRSSPRRRLRARRCCSRPPSTARSAR